MPGKSTRPPLPDGQRARIRVGPLPKRQTHCGRALGPATKVVRWARRRPMAALAAALIMALAVGGPLMAMRESHLLRQRNAALLAEKQARTEAEEQRNIAQSALRKERGSTPERRRIDQSGTQRAGNSDPPRLRPRLRQT